LGEGETDEAIIAKVIEQNNILNEKSIEFERRTLEERRTRWSEVVSFITQRGSAEWDGAVEKFRNEWKNWQLEAEREIEKGKTEYITALEKLNGAYIEWTKKALEAESKGLLEEMYNELDSLIAGYKESINASLPGKLNLHIDTAGIYKEVLSKVDMTGLGSLASSMKTSMKTGLTDILSVSYTDAKKMYEKVVEDNRDAIDTAKSVKQLEMLNAVRDGYEKQLEAANEGNYDSIVTGMIPGITKSLNESGDFDGVIPIVRQGSFESSQGDKILEVRVVKSASLVGGNKYKTIKVDDYKNYYKELAFKNVKMPGGAEIDFDDVRTFKDIEADELKSYVEYEKSYLEGEMERTFKVDFADYSKTELNDRISKELNDATGKYIAGEAMKDAPAHRKSIVPGAPDITTVTRVAATIGASCVPGVGPFLALAVQGAFIALDKHDGYIASWKQAGVQFGIAAVTTFATMGAGGAGWSQTQVLGMQTGINVATSGIKYNSDGSIGWSNDQFKAGIKSGAVNFALGYAGQKSDFLKNNGWARSGMTSFVNNTLDFEEGGWKIGIRNDNNWGDRFAGAVASASAAYATEKLTNMMKEPSVNTKTPGAQSNGADRKTYTGGITTQEYASHLISNTVNAGIMSAYNMARYDMSWSQASTITGFYSGTGYSAADLGGFTGSLAMGAAGHFYQKRLNNQAVDEAEKEGRTATDAEGNPLTKDPLGKVENFLAGMYESICGGMARVKGLVDGVTGAVATFGEKLGNLLTGDGFNTDNEVTQNIMTGIKTKVNGKSIDKWSQEDVDSLTEKERETLKESAAGYGDLASARVSMLLGDKLSTSEMNALAKEAGVYYGDNPDAVLVGGNEKFQKHYDRLQDSKSNYMLEKQIGEQARQANKNLGAYADQGPPNANFMPGQTVGLGVLALSDNINFANEIYFIPRNINRSQDQLVTAEIIRSISNYLDSNDEISDDFKEQIMNSVLSKKYGDALITSPDYYKDNPWDVNFADAYMKNRDLSEIIGGDDQLMLYGGIVVREERKDRLKHLQDTVDSFTQGEKALTNCYNSKKDSNYWIIPNDNLSKIKEAQLKELNKLRVRYEVKKNRRY